MLHSLSIFFIKISLHLKKFTPIEKKNKIKTPTTLLLTSLPGLIVKQLLALGEKNWVLQGLTDCPASEWAVPVAP